MRAFHSARLGGFGDAGSGYAAAGAATLNVIGDLIKLFSSPSQTTTPTTLGGGSCGSGFILDPSSGRCVPLSTQQYGAPQPQQQPFFDDTTVLVLGGGLLLVVLASRFGK